MSNSRSDRRRQERGGSAPPPKRDPMTIVYLSAAVLVVAVIAIFLIMSKWQQHQVDVATATPTPAPSAASTSKPIPLTDGEVLGKALIPTTKGLADTPKGGLGQPVDGITCGGMEYGTLHIHTHLSIFYRGTQVQVPRLIGAAPIPPQGCLYWIHTHSTDGIIHVESPQLAPEGSAGFDLGMLFDIWGQPLARDNIAGLRGPVVAYVNGTLYDGDLRAIPLRSHQQVVLEVGTPTVPPPNYVFPPAD
jgi:hypothetical protein